mgnify:CR=1 FL=1
MVLRISQNAPDTIRSNTKLSPTWLQFALGYAIIFLSLP